MLNTITCTDLFGKPIEVLQERVTFRPSAYGIITHNDHILLCNTRSTGKYSLPGGGIEAGESFAAGLRREVQEECGIEIDTQEIVDFEEKYFYYNPTEEAWQVHAVLYSCTPKSLELGGPDEHELEAEHPRWVPIASLREEDFQALGECVMRYRVECEKMHIPTLTW